MKVVKEQTISSRSSIFVNSLSCKGDFEVIPTLLENGLVETLSLKGAWKEDVLLLKESLNMRAFNPQSGEEIGE